MSALSKFKGYLLCGLLSAELIHLLATYACSLKDSLGLIQNPSSQADAIRDGLVLLGFLVFFRICVYYALRRKTAGL